MYNNLVPRVLSLSGYDKGKRKLPSHELVSMTWHRSPTHRFFQVYSGQLLELFKNLKWRRLTAEVSEHSRMKG